MFFKTYTFIVQLEMIRIETYSPQRFDDWNNFVAQSKNGTFLIDRRYMDYHQKRFHDMSLMFYDKKRLVAVLPSHDEGGHLYSHRGLSYGGLILNNRATTVLVCEIFRDLNIFLREIKGFSHVEYKAIPWIYHRLPSEEPLYALTKVCQAQLKSRDVASVVILDRRLPFVESRRGGIRKAVRAGVSVAEMDDFSPFWSVLEANLMVRHHARPIHSLEEIMLLKSRFPQNIRLYVACYEGTVIGGTVLYIDRDVVKTQYISASEQGKEMGALDFLMASLLDKFAHEDFRYFDFGTSNFKTSDDLHESLIFQKEGFGGRTVCCDTYEWEL